MQATIERRRSGPPGEALEVKVRDFLGHRTVTLRDLDPDTPALDLLGYSKTSLGLPPDVEWQLRDNATARIVRPNQPIGAVARQGKADLTAQPDAHLG